MTLDRGAASEHDVAALQGDWEQVGLEVDGVSDPPDSYGTNLVTTFAGTRFVVRAVDRAVVLAGSFTLDASTVPKTVDWVDSMGADAGKVLPAIYVLDHDRFVFVAASEGAPRPTRFATTTGQTMRSFVRRPSGP